MTISGARIVQRSQCNPRSVRADPILITKGCGQKLGQYAPSRFPQQQILSFRPLKSFQSYRLNKRYKVLDLQKRVIILVFDL